MITRAKRDKKELELEVLQLIEAVECAELNDDPMVLQLLAQLEWNPTAQTVGRLRQLIKKRQIERIKNRLPKVSGEFNQGNIHLGKDLFEDKHLFGDFQKIFSAHTVMVAQSGYGKSTLAIHLLHQASQLDPVNGILVVECGKIGMRAIETLCPNLNIARPEDIHINPCEVEEGTNSRDALQPYADAIADALDSTQPGRRWITQCLDRSFADRGIHDGSRDFPTLAELREYILKGRDRKIVDGILNRLDPCLQNTNIFATRQGWSTEQLCNTFSLLELESQNETIQKLVVGTIIAKSFVHRRHSREPNLGCDFLCMLDDCQHLCGHENSFIVKNINVMRSAGMAFVLSFQAMQNVHPSILANAATIFCGHLRDPQDRDTTLRSMGIMSLLDQRAVVRKQHQKGVFLLSVADRSSPFFIRIPKRELPFSKSHDPGTLLTFPVEKKQDENNWSPPEWRQVEKSKDDEKLRYLRVVKKCRGKVGMSDMEQANGLKKAVRDQLLKNKLLDSDKVKLNGTGRDVTILTLSPAGENVLKEAFQET